MDFGRHLSSKTFGVQRYFQCFFRTSSSWETFLKGLIKHTRDSLKNVVLSYSSPDPWCCFAWFTRFLKIFSFLRQQVARCQIFLRSLHGFPFALHSFFGWQNILVRVFCTFFLFFLYNRNRKNQIIGNELWRTFNVLTWVDRWISSLGYRFETCFLPSSISFASAQGTLRATTLIYPGLLTPHC